MFGYAKSDLELMVSRDEKILWQGRPNKRGFILEGIFNPLLPFALLWLSFDLSFILSIFHSSSFTVNGVPTAAANALGFMIPFFALHMMPVWIYLAGVLFIFRKYRHTEYIVTDKGVYISGGMFSYTCDMKPFTELARVNIHRGIIDQMIGVGDVVLTSNNVADLYGSSSRFNGRPLNIGLTIADIRNYREVFELIKKLQQDVYTDTMYPNDLRPPENHGYNTEYKGME